MKNVAVIDYGMGNLRSVCKAIEHVSNGIQVRLTSDPDVLRQADRIVFPGQGAIRGCVTALESRGLRAALVEAAGTKPLLGICLGLQALYDYSEEHGGTQGLGILPGRVPRFPADGGQKPATGQGLKIPHMGWNQVHQRSAHPLWQGIPQDARFYFVHSYYVDSTEQRDVAATTDYGITFTSAAARANIFAVQFHPEKSQLPGLRLLKNFIEWDGNR